jgi:hypothetical protein
MRNSLFVMLLAVVACAACTSTPTARTSPESAPWLAAWDAEWVDQRIVNRGYVPLTHGDAEVYCRMNDAPKTGSRLGSKVFCVYADDMQAAAIQTFAPAFPNVSVSAK